MLRSIFLKLFIFLVGMAAAFQASAQDSSYFSQLFTEQVLTVTRESDGIIPGSLRTTLIQASGIRAQNPFTLVKIVFDPNVKRIRLSKGPLPEISGSLISIDCQNPQGRVLIEGVSQNAEGVDPTLEVAGFKLTSNGNSIRNCHLTGFRGPGILIRGNRNVVEYNTLGYHKEVAESAVESSALLEEPKTNQGPGILIADGSSENLIQSNDIVANTSGGVEIAAGAGKGNKVLYNLFAKNSGKPIKVTPGPHSTRPPQITRIQLQDDSYSISGTSEAGVDLQIYLLGKEENEIGMIVVPSAKVTGENFTVVTKSKGFIPNQSKIVALAHGRNRNTSEFSAPGLIPNKDGEIIGLGHDSASAKPSAGAPEPMNALPSDKSPKHSSLAHEIDGILINDPTEAETVINIQGMGEESHTPEMGGIVGKSLIRDPVY
ncbi:MAG TPA: hypothetical protein DF383_03715 [Deltaproteobacteria bacterium]|nr:hypothetical protein [Deltaproteobacteria bacterium]